MTFRSINRWTLDRMVISTALDNCIISRDNFILHCDNKYRRTEYGSSLGSSSVVRFELDQIIMALCRIFDVIKQLSTL
jgi:hypothetical protein